MIEKTTDAPHVVKQIIRLLEQSGVWFRLHKHQEVCTMAQARQRVPHLTENLIKTIVFKIKASHWVLAAVHRDSRIDYKQLAAALGVKRRALRSISAEQVTAALGFDVGGVGPFRLNEHIQVVVDDRLKSAGKIFCGSGINTQTVEMEIKAVIRLSHALVAPITK